MRACLVLFIGALGILRSQANKPQHPKLSATELQQLTAQRQHDLDIIAFTTDLLNTSSFGKRTEIYCRLYVDQAPSFQILGVHSEKDVEQLYAKLMRSEPPTREQEVRRQYQLKALLDRIEAFNENVSTCRGMVRAGAQRIPAPDELREKLADARKHLAGIDRDIATGVISAPEKPIVKNQPKLPDSQPILLSKVDPDYSDEARRAKFNGNVQVSITIDEHGYVESVTVLNSPGLGLDNNIVTALQKWRFKPAIKGGVPVTTKGVLAWVSFRYQ